MSSSALLLVGHKRLRQSQAVTNSTTTVYVGFRPSFFRPGILRSCVLPLLRGRTFDCQLLTLSPRVATQLRQVLTTDSQSVPCFSIVGLLSSYLRRVVRSSDKSNGATSFRSQGLFRELLTCMRTRCRDPVAITSLTGRTLVGGGHYATLFRGCARASPVGCITGRQLFLTGGLVVNASLSVDRVDRTINCGRADCFIRRFQHDCKLPPLGCQGRFKSDDGI